jgi:hypothetical protein
MAAGFAISALPERHDPRSTFASKFPANPDIASFLRLSCRDSKNFISERKFRLRQWDKVG